MGAAGHAAGGGQVALAPTLALLAAGWLLATALGGRRWRLGPTTVLLGLGQAVTHTVLMSGVAHPPDLPDGHALGGLHADMAMPMVEATHGLSMGPMGISPAMFLGHAVATAVGSAILVWCERLLALAAEALTRPRSHREWSGAPAAHIPLPLLFDAPQPLAGRLLAHSIEGRGPPSAPAPSTQFNFIRKAGHAQESGGRGQRRGRTGAAHVGRLLIEQ